MVQKDPGGTTVSAPTRYRAREVDLWVHLHQLKQRRDQDWRHRHQVHLLYCQARHPEGLNFNGAAAVSLIHQRIEHEAIWRALLWLGTARDDQLRNIRATGVQNSEPDHEQRGRQAINARSHWIRRIKRLPWKGSTRRLWTKGKSLRTIGSSFF